MANETTADGGEEQPTGADALAEGIAGDMDRLIEFKSDVDPDDVLETDLKLFRSHRLDGVRLAYSATTVIRSDDASEYLETQVEPDVDKRKCPHSDRKYGGKTVVIGTMTYTGEGEILDHDIQPEYRTEGAEDCDGGD